MIAKEIIEGIVRYNKDKWTALMTDYSRAGIDYIITPKYCRCAKIHP